MFDKLAERLPGGQPAPHRQDDQWVTHGPKWEGEADPAHGFRRRANLSEAIESGAEGYLLKKLREDEFADQITRVRQGEPVMSPGLAKILLKEFIRLRGEKRNLEVNRAIPV